MGVCWGEKSTDPQGRPVTGNKNINEWLLCFLKFGFCMICMERVALSNSKSRGWCRFVRTVLTVSHVEGSRRSGHRLVCLSGDRTATLRRVMRALVDASDLFFLCEHRAMRPRIVSDDIFLAPKRALPPGALKRRTQTNFVPLKEAKEPSEFRAPRDCWTRGGFLHRLTTSRSTSRRRLLLRCRRLRPLGLLLLLPYDLSSRLLCLHS